MNDDAKKINSLYKYSEPSYWINGDLQPKWWPKILKGYGKPTLIFHCNFGLNTKDYIRIYNEDLLIYVQYYSYHYDIYFHVKSGCFVAPKKYFIKPV